MKQVIMILNGEGEGTAFLTEKAEMTGSFQRAYKFEPGENVKVIAEQFCKEHKGVEFVAGEEREYSFGYEIQDVND